MLQFMKFSNMVSPINSGLHGLRNPWEPQHVSMQGSNWNTDGWNSHESFRIYNKNKWQVLTNHVTDGPFKDDKHI
jgi:hypothetical protein